MLFCTVPAVESAVITAGFGIVTFVVVEAGMVAGIGVVVLSVVTVVFGVVVVLGTAVVPGVVVAPEVVVVFEVTVVFDVVVGTVAGVVVTGASVVVQFSTSSRS